MGTTQPRRRGRPPVHRREDLLEAAAERLLTRGYAGLRYQDVSEASGVAVASLRHYFPTLAELRKEALRHLVRSELETLREQLREVEDPWERVRLFFTGAVQLDEDQRKDSWVLWLEYWRAAAHDPEIRAHRLLVDSAWDELMEECIQDGVDSGDFQLDQPVAEAARELHALIDGYGTRLTVEYSREDAERAVSRVHRAVRRMLSATA